MSRYTAHNAYNRERQRAREEALFREHDAAARARAERELARQKKELENKKGARTQKRARE